MGGIFERVEMIDNSIEPQNELKNGAEYSDIYEFFMDQLDSKEAIEYLKGRGISMDVSFYFKAKVINDRLEYRLQKEMTDRFGIERLVESGLYSKGKTKIINWFYRQQTRLIYPIFAKDNKTIIALQGRNIHTQKNPGHLLLKGIKKPTLYHAYDLGQYEKILLCEGLIDTISAYQFRELGEVDNDYGIVGLTSISQWNDTLLDNEFKDKKMLYAFDNDEPARRLLKKIRKKTGGRLLEIDWDVLHEYNDINDMLRGGYVSKQR